MARVRLATGVFALLASCSQAPNNQPGEQLAKSGAALRRAATLPLTTWFNGSHKDYLSIADETWVGDGAGYAKSRVEGWILPPDLGAQPGTAPLYYWWGDAASDGLLTGDAGWAPGTSHPGYHFVRIEGYVYTSQAAGLVPLHAYWSDTNSDSMVSTRPDWAVTAPAGYRRVGLVGHVLATDPRLRDVSGKTPRGGERWDAALASQFGYKTMGYGGVAPLGTKRVLVLKVSWDAPRPGNIYDVPVAPHRSDASYLSWVAGPAYPNLASFVLENSDGNMRLDSRVTVASVAMNRTNPGYKVVNTSGVVTANPEGFSPGAAGDMEAFTSVIQKATGVDWAAYDTNGDGRVTDDELRIIQIWNNPGLSQAANRNINGAPRPVSTGPTVEVQQQAMVGVECDFHTWAHEFLHSFGAIDVYPTTGFVGSNASIMGDGPSGGLSAAGAHTTHLDPWHKMMLGWVKPDIRSLRDPSLETLFAQGARTGAAAAPILLFDPSVGTNQFWLVEYRRPNGGYDREVNSGLAIWYVRTTSPGVLSNAPAATGGAGGRNLWFLGTAGWGVGGFQTTANAPIELQIAGAEGFRPSGFSIAASALDADSAVAEWYPTTTGLVPRIDSLWRENVVPGSTFTAKGAFGRDSGRSAKLLLGSSAYDLTTTSWSPTAVTLQVPTGVPLGIGSVVFSSERAVAGNSLPFRTVSASPPDAILSQDGKTLLYDEERGNGTFLALEQDGDYEHLAAYPGGFRRHWSHIVAATDPAAASRGEAISLFYDRAGGTVAIVRTLADGTATTIATHSVAPGYTQVVDVGDGRGLFYKPDGTAITTQVSSTGGFAVLRTLSGFSSAWTNIVRTADGNVFFYAASGAAAAGEVDASGSFTTTWTGVVAAGCTHVAVVGGDRLFLFKAGAGGGYGELGSMPRGSAYSKKAAWPDFSPTWTTVVGLRNARVVFYDKATGNAVVGAFGPASFTTVRSLGTRLGRGWSAVVSL